MTYQTKLKRLKDIDSVLVTSDTPVEIVYTDDPECAQTAHFEGEVANHRLVAYVENRVLCFLYAYVDDPTGLSMSSQGSSINSQTPIDIARHTSTYLQDMLYIDDGKKVDALAVRSQPYDVVPTRLVVPTGTVVKTLGM